MTTITVTGDYVIQSTDDLTLDGGSSAVYAAYTLAITPPIYAVSLTDNGKVHATSSQDNATVEGLLDTSTAPAYHTDTIGIGAGAVFSVSATGAGSTAFGFYGYSGELGVFLTNDGTFTVSGGHATGAYVGGGGTFTNDAVFTVTGGDSALGLYVGYNETFTNNGAFTVTAASAEGVFIGDGRSHPDILNAGVFTVTGSTGATGFFLDNIQSGSFVNTGTIAVSSTTGSAMAIEIGAVYAAAPYAISNSGDITGFVGDNSNNPSRIDLTNTGTIDGWVFLNATDLSTHAASGYDNEIHNSGTITGYVYLSANGNDLYDGRGGSLEGPIILRGANATIFLGDDGESVWTSQRGASGHVTGGAGDDYIEFDPADHAFVVNAGGGNDFVWGGGGDDLLDGGPGNDTVWGGGGINTVSYASATAGVAVTLALQQPGPAVGLLGEQTGGSGYDTLSQFQNLVGSAYADTLTGDVHDNVLTGGAGADTFVFTAGADTVTDFSHAQGDRIDLDAFTHLRSFADVQAAAAQQGADTVITLGGGATLTLTGVQRSSLTASDFVLPTAAHLNLDLNTGGGADLLFRNEATGDWGVATMSASGFTWTDMARDHSQGFWLNEIGADLPDWYIDGIGDFWGTGAREVIFRNHVTGDWGISYVGPIGDYMGLSWNDLGPSTPSYSIDGTGDFNGDGVADVIFRNNVTGDWGYAAMHGNVSFTWVPLGPSTPSYAIAGTGDFNGDGTADIIFRDAASGDWGYAAMTRAGGYVWHDVGVTSVAYAIDGVGDFNGDGVTDILFRNHTTGDWGYAAMDRNGGVTWVPLGPSTTSYAIDGTGDFNGDGVADVIFRNHATGDWGYAAMHPGATFDWLPLGPSSTAYFIA